MKRIAVWILATGIPCALMAQEASSKPATADPALKETLVGMERKSWEAWKNRDGQFFQGFLSDDHVEIGFSGISDKVPGK